MKHLILSALIVLGSATSANAMLLGEYEDCGDYCLTNYILSTFSAPTILIGADINEMSQSEFYEFAHAEAQNYLDGVEGDYLLLKKTAEAMDQSVDQVAHDLINAKTEKN